MRRLLFAAVLVLAALPAAAQGPCPPGSTNCPQPRPPYSISWGPARPPALRASPHPAVVKIVSTRGDRGMHGTGTFLTERGRNDQGLVLTCAHVLRTGFTVTVVFPGGTSSRAKILATDALHDCALLGVVASLDAKGLSLATAYPRLGERLTWAGYGGQRGYAQGTAVVSGYRGDWLLARGRVREGDSGGPLFTARGLVAVVCEGEHGPGEPWQIGGPQVGWLRRFIDRYRAQQSDAKPPPSRPLVPVKPPIDSNCSHCSLLQKQIAALQKSVAALEARECSPGETGPAGPPGEDADCQSLVLRISAVESIAQQGLDAAKMPIYVKKVNTVTGEETVEEVHLGEGLIFKMTPHQLLTKREAQ